MRPSTIKLKLAEGKPALLLMLNTIDPSFFEMTSLFGFDGIWVDLEHNNPSVETLANLLRATRVGASDTLVRVAKGEFMRLGRVLEAGATGIMYARCDNAEEAREVVHWSRFAPLGKRGFCGGNADMPYCTLNMKEYLNKANEYTFVVIQLEDPQAVEHASEIARVPGIDLLFFGPADFSIASGIPGEFDHPKIQAAMDTIAEAARAAGIDWGTISSSVEYTKRLLEKGARMISYLSDTVIMKNQLLQIQRDFETLGFDFDKQVKSLDGGYLELE